MTCEQEAAAQRWRVCEHVIGARPRQPRSTWLLMASSSRVDVGTWMGIHTLLARALSAVSNCPSVTQYNISPCCGLRTCNMQVHGRDAIPRPRSGYAAGHTSPAGNAPCVACTPHGRTLQLLTSAVVCNAPNLTSIPVTGDHVNRPTTAKTHPLKGK
jgi:hypothetical protein